MDVTTVGPLRFDETPFLEITGEQWDALVSGIEAATLEVAAAARADGPGRIAVITSAAAARAIHGCALDAVAGAFLTTVAQVAAVELAGKGITANAVVPARPPDPATVDAVLGFLASEAAAGVTGAVIAADGGFSVTKTPGPKPAL